MYRFALDSRMPSITEAWLSASVRIASSSLNNTSNRPPSRRSTTNRGWRRPCKERGDLLLELAVDVLVPQMNRTDERP